MLTFLINCLLIAFLAFEESVKWMKYIKYHKLIWSGLKSSHLTTFIPIKTFLPRKIAFFSFYHRLPIPFAKLGFVVYYIQWLNSLFVRPWHIHIHNDTFSRIFYDFKISRFFNFSSFCFVFTTVLDTDAALLYWE